ncbi:biotin--[acetyl-CoA-carboxylase] ligase [Rhodoplanes azumiensis]|uniref:biotin--[biotin carboxyl-carrier protein] ligase n=1 Tax=Rhodoplanes azumiensis TaxID=1897628 RepID=A0ABW5AP51_9BRAD
MHAPVHDRLVAPFCSADRPDRRIGRTVLRIPVADSTNAMLIELGRAGAVDGTVLVADEQVAGRGKGERSWFSSRDESLCVSLLLRRVPGRDLSKTTLLAAVALHDAVTRLGVAASIKWPNDILIGDRKVCGILAEAATTTDGDVDFVVVGFGLNVAIAAETFPPELRGIATSLAQATGRAFDCATVLDACLDSFSTWVAILEDRGFAPIADAWRRGASTLGRRVVVSDSAVPLAGTAVALADDGALVLRDAAGHEHLVHSGDISHARAPVAAATVDR